MKKRIPVKEFCSAPEDYFTYITMDMFRKYHTEEEEKVFNKWMNGQTCGVIDGEGVVYSWDYERWIEQGRKKEQGRDWD